MAGPLEFKGDDGEDAHRFRRHSEKRRSIDAGRQLCQRNAPQARIFRTGPNSRLGCRRAFHRRGRQRICRRSHALRASHRSMRRQPPERRTRTTAGQAMFPLLSNMSSHPSYPKLGGLIVTLAVTLLTMVLSVITPIRLATFFWLAGTVAAMLLVPWVLSGLLSANAKAMLNDDNSTRMYFRVPPHYKFACLGLLAYCSLMLLPIPSWLWIVPLAFTVAAGIRWWRNTLWDDILQRPRRYWWLRRKRKANLSDTETKLGMKDKRVYATGYARNAPLWSSAQ